MFANFIYFIIALLIYAMYPAGGGSDLTPVQALTGFLGIALLFGIMTRRAFRKLEQQLATSLPAVFSHRFESLISRQILVAIGVFALDIYGLGLPSFFSPIRIFKYFPTLLAAVFMLVFAAYLALIWYLAYPVYEKVQQTGETREAYVRSNLAFALPVLMPWLVLSFLLDIVNLLPFPALKSFLETLAGQGIFMLGVMVLALMFAPWLILKTWKCTPMAYGPLRDRIETVCRAAGVQFAEIVYWPIFGGRMMTAGVVGIFSKFRYLLVTEALLRFSDPEELDAVVAHEIGHVKHRHMAFYVFFFMGFSIVGYTVIELFISAIVFTPPVYGLLHSTGLAVYMPNVFVVFLILVFVIYFRFIFGYFMRNFERQADTHAFSLFGTARPLITIFEKIARLSGQPPEKPSWHHFSIRERMDFLTKCETDPKWIRRHERKIRISILVYVAVFIILGAFGWDLKNGTSGRWLENRAMETIMAYDPQAIITLYQDILAENPSDAVVMNNLAWIYATTKDKARYNPARALALAQKAAALKPEDFILDTLAESYFVNGRYDAAVKTARQALTACKTDCDYLQTQLEKFLDAQASQKSALAQ